MANRGPPTRLLLSSALVALLSVGCQAALATVLDLPPPKPAPETPPAPPTGVAAVGLFVSPPRADTMGAPIEGIRTRDSVLALLPRDHAGNVDWVAALRAGTINPRPMLPRRAAPPEDGFRFGYDFTYPGPTPMFDAFFPHSTHTEVIACQQCHPRIFKYRNTKVVMADVVQGKFCGECHGKVAFNPATACERCHLDLKMPPNRAKAELLGDVTLARVTDSAGNAGKVDVSGLPRAVFPHWVHRIRYQCKTCHMELFEPRAGTNTVTMRSIADGRYCGTCHDGDVAFRPDMSNCQRCHFSVADGS